MAETPRGARVNPAGATSIVDRRMAIARRKINGTDEHKQMIRSTSRGLLASWPKHLQRKPSSQPSDSMPRVSIPVLRRSSLICPKGWWRKRRSALEADRRRIRGASARRRSRVRAWTDGGKLRHASFRGQGRERTAALFSRWPRSCDNLEGVANRKPKAQGPTFSRNVTGAAA